MSVERTFSIIKPDAVAAGNAGAILALLQKSGFKIIGMRQTRLSEAQAQALLLIGEDHRRFFEAFKNKQKPEFTGR